MRVLWLLVTLSVLSARLASAQVTATAADTAFARAVLLDALRAFNELGPQASQWNLEHRFVMQLTEWRMYDEAWRFALRRDSAWAQPGIEAEYRLTPRIIAAMQEHRDSAEAESRIAGLPAHVRDGALAQIVGQYRCTHPARADRLLAQIQDRFQRARAIARSAYPCTQADTERQRALLRAAIELAGDSVTGRRVHEVKSWYYQLKQLGGDVSLQQLVNLTQRGSGNLRQAQFEVAQMLVNQDGYQAAAPLLDTLLLQYQQDTPRPYVLLAMLHEWRRTGRDSAIALAMRDSMEQLERARPATQMPSSRQLWQLRSELQRAIDQQDRSRTGAALDSALTSRDPVGLIVTAADHMRTRHMNPRQPRDTSVAVATRIEFGRYLHDKLWQATTTMGGEARDSARVAIVALLASFDQERALVSQRELRVARMRDRALSEVVRSMVNADADRAAALAESLRDPVARNAAYLPLTERAVAGGRLRLATRFADRTASGTPLIRAQYAVANALFAADSISQARERIRPLLEHLDPIWRCDHCIFAADTTTVLIPERPGMDPRLIGDVILLAFRTGGADQLRTWAATRPSAEARASAGLALSEGWVQYRLRRWPNYPIH